MNNRGSLGPKLLLFIALLGIIWFLFSFERPDTSAIGKDVNIKNSLSSEPQISVMLYFADQEGTSIAFEDRRVPKRDSLVLQIREVIKAMTSSPHSRYLSKTLPEGTDIRAVYLLDDGLVYVDFNQELRSGHISGTTAEKLTIMSIVNTLCELPGVSRVRILIQGEEVDTIKGHIYIGEPLSAQRLPARS